MFTNVEQLEQK